MNNFCATLSAINREGDMPTNDTELSLECKDIWRANRCQKKLLNHKCGNENVVLNCEKTCGVCELFNRAVTHQEQEEKGKELKA